MSKDINANGYLHTPKIKNDNLMDSFKQKSINMNCPQSNQIQRSVKTPAMNSDNLNYSNERSTSHDGGSSPVTAFSRSFGGSHAATSLNVYSMSPRNTSVMYHYYKQPKGFFESQGPISHSPTHNNGNNYCINDHHSNNKTHNDLNRTTSECCESSNSNLQVPKGIPPLLYADVLDDPRRRAWSESDSNRKSNMHANRMSALKKLKMKLGRSGSLKKRKDETHRVSNDLLDHPNHHSEVADQNFSNKTSSPRTSQRSTVVDIDVDEFASLSLRNDSSTTSRTGDSLSTGDRLSSVFDDSIGSQDIELIYRRFLEEHTCYDIMPTSCKLVVFDTRLQARSAFHALIENASRSAPLWDSNISCYVGMLTVTDFIKVIIIAHEAENMKVESIEEETIDSWRKLLHKKSSFANVHPDDTLLHSLNILINEHFHGVPVMDESTGDIFHIINYKRILRFLHLFINELPKPAFMDKTLSEVKIGTYANISTVRMQDTMLDVMKVIAEKKLTAIPVVNHDDEVVDVFCKLDMLALAAQGLYHNLSTTIEVALACRFKPLFEDEECPNDAFTRFSSPKPQRRDMNVRRPYRAGNDVKMSNERRKANDHFRQNLQVTGRGHYVTRSPKLSRDPANGVNVRPHSYHHQSAAREEHPVTHDCAEHPVRHKLLSNPLVKCKLTDSLQRIIDLMVSTEANLLVVIGQKSNHVIGVVTVSDVLHYIVNPPGSILEQDSPPRMHRSSHGPNLSPVESDPLPHLHTSSPKTHGLHPTFEARLNSNNSSGDVDKRYPNSNLHREVLVSNL